MTSLQISPSYKTNQATPQFNSNITAQGNNNPNLDLDTNTDSVVIGLLIFARHGQSMANRQNVFAGSQYDAEISQEGSVQAHLLATNLKPILEQFNAVIVKGYVSTLRRAKHTMQNAWNELVSNHINPAFPVIVAPRLDEINDGVATGKSIHELRRHYGKHFVDNALNNTKPDARTFPGAQNFHEFKQQQAPYIEDIILNKSNFAPNNISKSKLPVILLVGHSNGFKAMLHDWMSKHAVQGVHIAPEQATRALIHNADPMVFAVVMNKRTGGLTMVATEETDKKIQKAVASFYNQTN